MGERPGYLREAALIFASHLASRLNGEMYLHICNAVMGLIGK